MATRIKCPKCEIWFDSDDAYHNHLPCDGGSLAAASGENDLRKEHDASLADGGKSTRASS